MAGLQDGHREDARRPFAPSRNKKSTAPITATSRLKNDYLRLIKDPVPYIIAEPLTSNILEWHYVVTGPKDSPYVGGYYHGKLVFPPEFPFKPPSIYMNTPNGRFKTHTRLCLSISDYHPDTWNPAWSVATIMTGLLSFMLEKSPTLGSIETPDSVKRKLAASSHEFNLKDRTFCELFPQVAEKSRRIIDQTNRVKNQRSDSNSNLAGNLGQSDSSEGRQHEGANPGFYGAVTNFLVIGGFAAFAFVVQYVIQSLTVAD